MSMRIHFRLLMELTWDVNENIPKDKVSVGVLKCFKYWIPEKFCRHLPARDLHELPLLATLCHAQHPKLLRMVFFGSRLSKTQKDRRSFARNLFHHLPVLLASEVLAKRLVRLLMLKKPGLRTGI